MRFEPTTIPGVVMVWREKRHDERGFFVRTYCAREFAAAGQSFVPVQQSLSLSTARGTLRGMHFQKPPAEERKLIFCLRGAVFDVALDLRLDSPLYGRWQAFELTEDDDLALLFPPGVAHGFLTLTDNVQMSYMVDAYYASHGASGVRWDDSQFNIHWPFPPTVISRQDRNWPSNES